MFSLSTPWVYLCEKAMAGDSDVDMALLLGNTEAEAEAGRDGTSPKVWEYSTSTAGVDEVDTSASF